MKLFLIIYLIIGFIFGIYIESYLHIISRDIIDSFGYDIDLDQPSIRFILFLVCLIGWPFFIGKINK